MLSNVAVVACVVVTDSVDFAVVVAVAVAVYVTAVPDGGVVSALVHDVVCVLLDFVLLADVDVDLHTLPCLVVFVLCPR